MTTLKTDKSTPFEELNDWTKNATYAHATTIINEDGSFCDVYFQCENFNITDSQIEIYNQFLEDYKKQIAKMVLRATSSVQILTKREQKKVKASSFTLDVLQIPFNPLEYDLLAVCSIAYKSYFFFKRQLTLEVQFQNGEIKTMKKGKLFKVLNQVY